MKIKKINNYIYKRKNIFIIKIFNKLIKNGKKLKAISMYINWLNLIKMKFKKVSIFIIQFLIRLVPKLHYKNLKIKGKQKIIPVIKKNKLNLFKTSSIVSLWIKKSFVLRKEKTFVLKFYSELNDIRLNKGNSIKLKNDYYKEFYLNKRYLKFKKKKRI